MTKRNTTPTATATIVPVEARNHRYEARTRIVGRRTGAVTEASYPLVDRDQVSEYVQHFARTAGADGHRVQVTDTTHGR